MSLCEECDYEQQKIIKIVGVGGAGGNFLGNIKDKVHWVDCIVAGTDALALINSKIPTKIQLGVNTAKGLGAGANPEVGRAAALEAIPEIEESLKGADMVIVLAGMGGGTGTGAAQIIAGAARNLGALTIGIVTLPFSQEGASRLAAAEEGVRVLSKYLDSLIVLQNDRICHAGHDGKDIFERYEMGDKIIFDAIRGITDLVTTGRFVGIDHAEMRMMLTSVRPIIYGVGHASGENCAQDACNEAMKFLSLSDVAISEARGALINITGPTDLTKDEYDSVCELIHNKVNEDCDIVMGIVADLLMKEEIKVTLYFKF
ncbi:MAG: cell division protein FtsZ [Legionella sp.]|uniref:cell division protein FtsZ n=1 Tax=Legionella sp. TaxID=459 RepID=UPI00284F5F67|nr:cell division protein FtsZ [Legionella sp.]